jgi:3-dehydroquinate synthase
VPSLTVSHRTGSYEVLVAPGLLAEGAARISAALPGRRLAIITDATIRAALTGAGRWPALDAEVLEIPAGEGAKCREEWARVTDRLLALGFGRDSALVALGGGSVGDLTGFVAATYLRGIPCVQLPTTLLAMVDASVGGKVGVDTPAGKNLVGAFHPPALVLGDPQALASLPDALYREGLAEAVKHGVVADAGYFEWIARHASALVAREGDAVAGLVTRSVAIKAAIVSRDELETGERAVLNAGHTVGHALELVSGYALRHGEAVAVGLVAECRLGERMGVTAPGTADRVARLLTTLGLPVSHPALTAPALRAAMSTDKKNRAGRIRMALPRAIGAAARDGDAWTWAVDAELPAAG